MNFDIFSAMLLNIGLLILVAQILARIRAVRRVIVYEDDSIKDQLFLILIFSSIGIISNYSGYSINGAIANTRVIGVMASGFIAGPVVSVIVGLVAGLHRYLIDINGFSTLACSISTVIGAIVAAVYSKRIKESNYRSSDLFSLTFTVECLQMLIILLLARPFDDALGLVRNIFLPMTIFNSVGMVLFVGVFKNIITEQDNKIGRKVGLTFDITQKCLPILRSGEFNEENCHKIGEIILDFSKDLAVVFTDTKRIISISGKIDLSSDLLPEISLRVFDKKEVIFAEAAAEGDVLHEPLKNMVGISVPLMKNHNVFGSMIIFSKKYRLSYESQIPYADGLGKLFSTQFELADMEKQRELLSKAEYKALQSQINPHFIFNSLNTISYFVREKPDDARELLIALATYFRNTIETENELVSIYEEMEYVDAFLQLVKARFEDRLEVKVDLEQGLDCMVPCLIVQPIVENAVFHGAMSRKKGMVEIKAYENKGQVTISVRDNGYGIPQETIERLMKGTIEDDSIGLANVHNRLCYIYGRENGLDIQSRPSGTIVNINFKKEKPISIVG